MTDVVDKATRSKIMARVRGRDTGPERVVRSGLHRLGFRFRLHARALPGSPDLVLPRRRAAVFVHGCFWHRHAGCRQTSVPASNTDHWTTKFAATVARDARATHALEALGWRVAVVWECELKATRREATVRRLADWLRATSVAP
jgi:DNA mismatch endonuclease, patch repair protein